MPNYKYINNGDILIADIEEQSIVDNGVDLTINQVSSNIINAARIIDQIGIVVDAPEQSDEDKQKLIDHALLQKETIDEFTSITNKLTDSVVIKKYAHELGINPNMVMSLGGVSFESDFIEVFTRKLDSVVIPTELDIQYPMHRLAIQIDVDDNLAGGVGDDLFGTSRATQGDVDKGLASSVDDVIVVARLSTAQDVTDELATDVGVEIRVPEFVDLYKNKTYLDDLDSISEKKTKLIDEAIVNFITELVNKSFKSEPIIPDLSSGANATWSTRFTEVV